MSVLLKFLESPRKQVAYYVLHRDAGTSMPPVAREPSDEDNDAIAKLFAARADAYAEQVGGSVAFVVAAYDERDRLVDSEPFTVGTSHDLLGPLSPVDPPTVSGVTANTLRHLEQRDKSGQKLLADLHQETRRQLAQQAARIVHLEALLEKHYAERLASMEAIETLKSQAHDRLLKQIESKHNAQVRTWLMEQAALYAPIIAGSITGSSKLADLVRDVKPEQWVKIGEALEPEQLGRLQGLLSTAEKADNAREKLSSA